MSDEAALLAAILAHPDEDTPRLMYADWLDEHGQPERAEFIRIQCRPDADEAAEQRVAELEERNRAKWLAGLPHFHSARWRFRRGFPEHLDAACGHLLSWRRGGDYFLEHNDACARVPWLRSLSLQDMSNRHMQDFANRSWNLRWVELEIHGPIAVRGWFDTTAFLSPLVGCSQVRQLHVLRLSLQHFEPETIDLLVASPNLETLQRLHLQGEHADPQFDPLRARFGERLVIG